MEPVPEQAAGQPVRVRSRKHSPPRPGTPTPGSINLPAVILIVMCTLLLIRGARESAVVNTIMVIIKLGVLLLFVVIAFTAFNTDHFAGFWTRLGGHHRGGQHDLLLLHRP